jgi:hypothetical protein
MNETILMIILAAIMGFFMIFGVYGVYREKKTGTDTEQ